MAGIWSGQLVGPVRDIWGYKSHPEPPSDAPTSLGSRIMSSASVDIVTTCSLQSPEQDHTLCLSLQRKQPPQLRFVGQKNSEVSQELVVSFPLQFMQGMLLAQFLSQNFCLYRYVHDFIGPTPARGPTWAGLYFQIQECCEVRQCLRSFVMHQKYFPNLCVC